MKKLTFEIRSPAHQQNAIHAVQQILPDPTKPIVVTIQERNRSLDRNRKLWACLGDVSRQVEWHGRWLDAESWKCVFTAALKQQDVAEVTGATVTSINQAAAKMARAGILVIDGKVWRTVYYRFATREEREGKVSTNLIFKECRQSAAMKRVLFVYAAGGGNQ
ncbi:hypothetical protein FEK48_14250 [Escherichia sp. E2593]|uniref:recombination protein NinB n=2 Tax=Escherichia TaxID=561 RepID=UPI00102A675D|nr:MULTISPECIES: recombination protein NinB [unclassified Escherichia]RZN40244.1 hypothetical protein D9738_14335 [Escherichia sp. E10V5]TGC10848.1 hypothetical protein CRG93_04200 [Escherichia sp. E2593]TLI81433.1 hypothetical protein FEK48_14250 [Escherichia sp. E2593]